MVELKKEPIIYLMKLIALVIKINGILLKQLVELMLKEKKTERLQKLNIIILLVLKLKLTNLLVLLENIGILNVDCIGDSMLF